MCCDGQKDVDVIIPIMLNKTAEAGMTRNAEVEVAQSRMTRILIQVKKSVIASTIEKYQFSQDYRFFPA